MALKVLMTTRHIEDQDFYLSVLVKVSRFIESYVRTQYTTVCHDQHLITIAKPLIYTSSISPSGRTMKADSGFAHGVCEIRV